VLLHTSRNNFWKLGIRLNKLEPLFVPPKAIELIPEAAPSRCWRSRGIRSGLLVQLRRWSHHPPLLSILLANVQSLDNKVCELRARISFQRDIRDCNILCFTESYCPRPYSQLGYQYIVQTGIKNSLGRRRKARVYASWLTTHGVNVITYRNSSPFVHQT
jgi:hypothetical protein